MGGVVHTGLRVAEVRQSHGVELSSVGDGSVQQAAAAPGVTAADMNTANTLRRSIFTDGHTRLTVTTVCPQTAHIPHGL